MYQQIKQAAYDANMQLPQLGLVLFTDMNIRRMRESLSFRVKKIGGERRARHSSAQGSLSTSHFLMTELEAS
jgi:hypothetical protein